MELEPAKCRYCNRLFREGESRRYVGGTIPQAKTRYPACDPQSPECKAAERAHFSAFHEMEANCNTCRHLIRVAHPKRTNIKVGNKILSVSNGGLLYGRCRRTPVDHPYAMRIDADGVFPFAPEDHMGMKCWEPR